VLEAVTVTGYKDADVLFAFNSRGFGGEDRLMVFDKYLCE